MANICNTSITISHRDDEKIKKIEEIIRNCFDDDCNHFDKTSLKHIAKKEELGNVCCRGSVVEMHSMNGFLTIATETSWSPCVKLFLKLLEKYLPDANLIYDACEPNCGVFITNNPDLAGKYYIDFFEDIEDFEPVWDATEADTVEILQELLKTEENNLEELLKLYENSELTECVAIHQWDYEDAEYLE